MKYLFFIVLFQFSITIKAQTKSDTLDIIKLYVDSVKLVNKSDMRCLDANWRPSKKYSEFPISELSCGIITTTIAFPKKQRVDRTYIIRDGKTCYYSEKRSKYGEYNAGSPPCLEVYFYDGKILSYKTNERSKKLTEKKVKEMIKKGGSNFGGIYSIIQQWE